MRLDKAIKVLSHELHSQCSEQLEEKNGDVCGAPSVWRLSNTKFDTEYLFCDAHRPEKAHYADYVETYEAGVALAVVLAALPKKAKRVKTAAKEVA